MSPECWKRFETALADCNCHAANIGTQFEEDTVTQISLMASLLQSIGTTLPEKSNQEKRGIMTAMQSMSEAICALKEVIKQELTKEGEERENTQGFMKESDEEMEEKDCPLFEEIPIDSIKTEVKEEPMEELANEFLTHSNPLVDHDYAPEMTEEQSELQPILAPSASVLCTKTNVLTPHIVPDRSEGWQSTVARNTVDAKKDELSFQSLSKPLTPQRCVFCDLSTCKYLVVPQIDRWAFLDGLRVRNARERQRLELMKGSSNRFFLCVHHVLDCEKEKKSGKEQPPLVSATSSTAPTPDMVPDGSYDRPSTAARSTVDQKLLLQCVSPTFVLRPCFLCELPTDKSLIVPHVNRWNFLLALKIKNEKEWRKVEMMKGSRRRLYICVHHVIDRDESKAIDAKPAHQISADYLSLKDGRRRANEPSQR